MSQKYKDATTKMRSMEGESQGSIVKLTKERDELLELVLQRGKIIEVSKGKLNKCWYDACETIASTSVHRSNHFF